MSLSGDFGGDEAGIRGAATGTNTKQSVLSHKIAMLRSRRYRYVSHGLAATPAPPWLASPVVVLLRHATGDIIYGQPLAILQS